MKQKILLVEDEENLLDIIKLNLELEGYSVGLAKNGKSALENFEQEKFDLIILDVMLPELNGFDVCRKIRLLNKNIPILFLTAKNTSEDRINGLKIGADDYLSKPFNLEELLLRVHNLIKRNSNNNETKELEFYKFGGNSVNFLSYEMSNSKGQKNILSKRETELLKLLIEKKNQVVSRDEILEKIWGENVFPTSRTIDNYILNFRKYFETNNKETQYFQSIRGVGYKFVD